MNEAIFWNILEEILGFGEFIIAVPNSAASANIVGKLSVAHDSKEKVIEKDSCHCHVHLEPEKVSKFSFIYIDAGYGKEPCCELKTSLDEAILRFYLRENTKIANDRFTGFSHNDSEFVEGEW